MKTEDLYLEYPIENSKSDPICQNPETKRLIPLNFGITLRIQNKYVDLGDIDEPIKSYKDLVDQWKLHPEIEYQSTHYIERQEVHLEDSIFPLFSEPEIIKFNRI